MYSVPATHSLSPLVAFEAQQPSPCEQPAPCLLHPPLYGKHNHLCIILSIHMYTYNSHLLQRRERLWIYGWIDLVLRTTITFWTHKHTSQSYMYTIHVQTCFVLWSVVVTCRLYVICEPCVKGLHTHDTFKCLWSTCIHSVQCHTQVYKVKVKTECLSKHGRIMGCSQNILYTCTCRWLSIEYIIIW